MMITKAERDRMTKLFTDTISLLCRGGLPSGIAFRVDALIGVTLGADDVLLVKITENYRPNESSVLLDDSEAPLLLAIKEELDSQSVNNNIRSIPNRLMPNEAVVASSENVECGSPSISGIVDANIVAQQTYLPSDRSDSCMRITTFPWKEVNCGNLSSSMSNNSISGLYDNNSNRVGKMTTDDDCVLISADKDIQSAVGVGSNDDPAAVNFTSKHKPEYFSSADATKTFVRKRYKEMSRKVSLAGVQKHARSSLKMHVISQSNLMSKTESSHHDLTMCDDRPNFLPPFGSLDETFAAAAASVDPLAAPDTFQCQVCGASLRGRQTLQDHIRGTHLAMYSYRCADCGQCFKWRSTLRRHRSICFYSVGAVTATKTS